MQAEAQYAAKMPPVLLLHGTDDTCALVKNVMQFEEALRKAGVKASGRLKVSEVSWVPMFPAVVAAVLFRGSFCVALHQADVKVSLGLVASQSLSICPWSPNATLQRFPCEAVCCGIVALAKGRHHYQGPVEHWTGMQCTGLHLMWRLCAAAQVKHKGRWAKRHFS